MARNNNAMNNTRRANNNTRNNSSSNSLNNRSNSGFSMGGTEWIIVILVLVGLVGVYFYMQQSKHNSKEGFSVKTELTPEGNKVAVVFFNTDWCGHCQNFKPKWEKLKQEMDGTKINGVDVSFISVDCDEKAELGKAYNVSGYPTIKLLTDSEVIEYDDERSESKLRQFIREHARNVANQ